MKITLASKTCRINRSLVTHALWTNSNNLRRNSNNLRRRLLQFRRTPLILYLMIRTVNIHGPYGRWTSLLTNLCECHFVTLGLCRPYPIKSDTSVCHLWMILESQPVDDSSSICSNACLTNTHLKAARCHGLNPHSSRRVNKWKLLTMAQWHEYLNLKNEIQKTRL